MRLRRLAVEGIGESGVLSETAIDELDSIESRAWLRKDWIVDISLIFILFINYRYDDSIIIYIEIQQIKLNLLFSPLRSRSLGLPKIASH